MAKKDTNSNKIQHTKKAIIDALEKSLGVVTTACKIVGIDRTTFYRYLKDDPDFAKEVQDIEDIAIDFVESQLFKQIKEGNTTATIFYLKTKAKKRGYVERQEVTGAEGAPLVKIDLDKLNIDELRQLERLANKLEGGAGSDSEEVV